MSKGEKYPRIHKNDCWKVTELRFQFSIRWLKNMRIMEKWLTKLQGELHDRRLELSTTEGILYQLWFQRKHNIRKEKMKHILQLNCQDERTMRKIRQLGAENWCIGQMQNLVNRLRRCTWKSDGMDTFIFLMDLCADRVSSVLWWRTKTKEKGENKKYNSSSVVHERPWFLYGLQLLLSGSQNRGRGNLDDRILSLWSSGLICKEVGRYEDLVAHCGSLTDGSVQTPFGWGEKPYVLRKLVRHRC